MSYQLAIIIAAVAVGFFLIFPLVMQGKKKVLIKSKSDKKNEIISDYKARISRELEPFKSDKKLLLSKKNALLMQFNNELSQNIFFDSDEIHEIIKELASS